MDFRKFFKTVQKEAGQSLVEVIIAVGLMSIVFAGSWQLLHTSFISINQELNELKAHYYVVEGLEGIRSIRDEGWNTLSTGTWHFEWVETGPSNFEIQLVAGSETVSEGFTRSIVISEVRRRTDTLKITEDLGYPVDQDTLRVDVTVEWNYGSTTLSDSESIYLTNWMRN